MTENTGPPAHAPFEIDPENYQEAEDFGVRHERPGKQKRETSFGSVMTDERGVVVGVARKIGITSFGVEEGTNKRVAVQGPVEEYPTRENLLTLPGFLDRTVYPLEGDVSPTAEELAEKFAGTETERDYPAGPKDSVLTAPTTVVPGPGGETPLTEILAETEEPQSDLVGGPGVPEE